MPPPGISLPQPLQSRVEPWPCLPPRKEAKTMAPRPGSLSSIRSGRRTGSSTTSTTSTSRVRAAPISASCYRSSRRDPTSPPRTCCVWKRMAQPPSSPLLSRRESDPDVQVHLADLPAKVAVRAVPPDRQHLLHDRSRRLPDPHLAAEPGDHMDPADPRHRGVDDQGELATSHPTPRFLSLGRGTWERAGRSSSCCCCFSVQSYRPRFISRARAPSFFVFVRL